MSIYFHYSVILPRTFLKKFLNINVNIVVLVAHLNFNLCFLQAMLSQLLLLLY